MKDFNFQLFGVLRGSTLGFDGSPLWYLTFYSNLSGRGVVWNLKNILSLFQIKIFPVIFMSLENNILFAALKPCTGYCKKIGL